MDTTTEIGTVEAARILGCSPANVQRAIRNKRLPATITASGYKMQRSDVERYKTTRRKPGRPPTREINHDGVRT